MLKEDNFSVRHQNCLLCASPVARMRSLPHILKCEHCGFAFIENMPDEARLRSAFEVEYFKGYEYLDYEADKNAIQKNFRKRIGVLERFSKGGNLLEIGSALGFFQQLAKIRWNACGIDISKYACDYARSVSGVDVRQGDFLTMDIPLDYYDIACLWDTIEHLKNPHDYINKISNIIKRRGLLCITTGDCESPVARLMDGKWRLFHCPTHLNFFSKRSLYSMLKSNNFEIIHFQRCGNFRSLSQMSAGFSSNKNFTRNLRAFLERLRLSNLPVYLNLYDIMFVVAEKQ